MQKLRGVKSCIPSSADGGKIARVVPGGEVAYCILLKKSFTLIRSSRLKGIMKRNIQTLALLLTLCAAMPAATFNAGVMFLTDNGDNTGILGVENLTGNPLLGPDFPILTELSFSGTLTIRYCNLNVDCSDAGNVTSADLQFVDPFLPGGQTFGVATNVKFLFDEFTFSGSFLPVTPFEVGGVFFQPVDQSLRLLYLNDPNEPPTWLFTVEGREVDTAAIPEPSTVLLVSAGVIFLLRRR
jgi:hypothetical protein